MIDNRAIVFWFTGLSGSGKTTIAEALRDVLILEEKKVLVLDGDSIRLSNSNKLGFSEEDIKTNNLKVAKLVIKNQINYDYILVPIISPYRKHRNLVRKIIKNNFNLLYVNCTVEECIQRDTKGLYKKALEHKITNMIGISEKNPYEPPVNSELTIDTINLTLEKSINLILNFLKS